MYQVIAPTLFRNKICRLPGIGTLVMIPHSAETDFVNSLIKSPFETIDFVPEKKGEKVFNEFSAISELLQKKLDENNSFFIKGIGTFTKGKQGEIKFVSISVDPAFTLPVPVKRVIRQDAEHAILVGDQQTTNVEMTDFFNERQSLKDLWWIWAIILALVGIGALIFYYAHNGINGIGNTIIF
jgi:hypothetical protein